MVKIAIDIENCSQCPFIKKERHYTADSFEMAFDWFCEAEDNKIIAGYVEWHEEKKTPIPTWCPKKTKRK